MLFDAVTLFANISHKASLLHLFDACVHSNTPKAISVLGSEGGRITNYNAVLFVKITCFQYS